MESTGYPFLDYINEDKSSYKHAKDCGYVDEDDLGHGTLNRYKKDSFTWYQKVIRTNGADLS